MGSRKPGAQLRQVNQHLKFTVQLASYEGINPLESQKFGVTSSTGQATVYNAENASPHTLSEQPSNLTWCQNRERRWNQTSLYRTAKLQTNRGQLPSQRGIWEEYLSSYCRHIKNYTLHLSGYMIYYFKPCRSMERHRLPVFSLSINFLTTAGKQSDKESITLLNKDVKG